MQTIVTDACSVCLSVCPSISLSHSSTVSVAFVQPLSKYFASCCVSDTHINLFVFGCQYQCDCLEKLRSLN